MPTDASTLLQQGIALLSSGRVAEAERIYRDVLEREPDNADALHLLGVAAFHGGRAEEALALIGRAVALNPDAPDYHNNYGLALARSGRGAEAEARYRVAIRLNPRFAQAHYHLANRMAETGRGQLAARHYRAAVECDPAFADARYNLARLLQAEKREAEAEAELREVLRIAPGYAPAHNQLALIAAAAGRDAEAEAHYCEALALQSNYAQAHNNLGNLLQKRGEFAAAAAHFRQAIAHEPLMPQPHAGLGMALESSGKTGEAIAHFRQAIALSPDDAETHAGLGMALLSQGAFAEGWREYEWRLRIPGYQARFLATERSLWRGEPVQGKRLLLWGEQGLGDVIQFCRYVPLLGGARVTLKVRPPLVRLLSALPGVDEVVAEEERDAFDLHCPLISLPLIFGTTLENVPAAAAYLRAPPDRVGYWHEKLSRLEGRKIGLAWAGNPKLPADRRRSIPPELFERLKDIPGIRFISLQKESASQPRILAHDWTNELSDLAETAALITGLDLVISVDTAVAHLAGALGKPVWLLNRFDADWRWLRGRSDSPWYPFLRQFRQPRPGDWDSVLNRVTEALAGS